MISDPLSLKKSFSEFQNLITSKTLVVDIKDDTSKGIIKNSLYIAFSDKFKVLFPSVVKLLDTSLLLSMDPLKNEEILLTLQTLGFSNILGYLEGGFDNWLKNNGEITSFSPLEPEKFKELYASTGHDLSILDVRNPPECYDNGVLATAKLIPLKDLEQELIKQSLEELKKKKLYIYCGLGPRSMIASSILKKYGFTDVNYIIGGHKKMLDLGYEMKKIEKL